MIIWEYFNQICEYNSLLITLISASKQQRLCDQTSEYRISIERKGHGFPKPFLAPVVYFVFFIAGLAMKLCTADLALNSSTKFCQKQALCVRSFYPQTSSRNLLHIDRSTMWTIHTINNLVWYNASQISIKIQTWSSFVSEKNTEFFS